LAAFLAPQIAQITTDFSLCLSELLWFEKLKRTSSVVEEKNCILNLGVGEFGGLEVWKMVPKCAIGATCQ
jgi:hypothetical protein